MATQVERPAPTSTELSSETESYLNSDYFQRHAKSDNSKYAYGADLGLFRDYLSSVGVLSFDDLKMDHIVGWVGQMSGAASTIDRRLSSVRIFLNWLVENNLSQEDFSAKVPVKKDDRALPFEVLGHDRYMALVEHLRREGELRDLAIVELLINTGADVTEVTNMNIGDIGKLRGREVVARLVKPRTGKERTVILNETTVRAIGEYLSQRENHGKDEPLFVSKHRAAYTNRRLTRGGLWLRLQEYKHVIGVGELNQRIFTNTFVDNFEGDVKSLAGVMGISEFSARDLYQKRLAN